MPSQLETVRLVPHHTQYQKRLTERWAFFVLTPAAPNPLPYRCPEATTIGVGAGLPAMGCAAAPTTPSRSNFLITSPAHKQTHPPTQTL